MGARASILRGEKLDAWEKIVGHSLLWGTMLIFQSPGKASPMAGRSESGDWLRHLLWQEEARAATGLGISYGR
ncbi:hypothetical protein ACXWOZ_09240, partial [Streptococcus pyogenes]